MVGRTDGTERMGSTKKNQRTVRMRRTGRTGRIGRCGRIGKTVRTGGTEGTENTGGTVNERGAYTYVAIRTAIVTRMSRGRSKVIMFSRTRMRVSLSSCAKSASYSDKSYSR